MRNSYALTKAEVEEEINYYKKIFTVVRILKRNQIAGICSKEDIDKVSCPCYSFWKKHQPCENCISEKAMRLKKD